MELYFSTSYMQVKLTGQFLRRMSPSSSSVCKYQGHASLQSTCIIMLVQLVTPFFFLMTHVCHVVVIISFRPTYFIVYHCGYNINLLVRYPFLHIIPCLYISRIPKLHMPQRRMLPLFPTCISHPNSPLFGSLPCSPPQAQCCNHSLISFFLFPCSLRAQPRKRTYNVMTSRQYAIR